MANTLRFKRGLLAGLPSAAVGEPLFTTDTFDLYIGTASGTQKYQKFIASGTTSQLLRGDGSLLTMPIVLSSPANGEVLKYNGTNWVNSSDAGITGSGSAGQVAYWGSSSTITGSNNLFWDSSNSRLGIGTASPQNPLHINGVSGNAIVRWAEASTTRGFIGSSNGLISGQTTYFAIRGESGLILSGQGNAINLAVHPTSGNIIINNGVTDNGLRFQVTGDGYFSGSVGIGVSPTQKLNVSGSGNYLAGFVNSAGTAAALIYFSNTSGEFYIGNDRDNGAAISGTPYARAIWGQGAYPMVFGTNNIERMRLDASGNLGLGVNPFSWVNTMRSIDLEGGVTLASLKSGQNLYLLSNAYYDTSWKYKSFGYANWYEHSGGNHIWHNAPIGSANAALTWTPAMTLFSNGNLAVGPTTNQGFKLDVNGTGRFSSSTNGEQSLANNNKNNGTSAISVFNLENDASVGQLVYTSSTYTGIYTGIGANTHALINRSATGSFKIIIGGYQDAQTRFTISSTGAATFSSSVTANSAIKSTTVFGGTFTASDGTDEVRFGSYYNTIGTGNSYDGVISVGKSTGKFIFRLNGSDRATFTPTGNLLVGTTTDSGERLVVSGNAKIDGVTTIKVSRTNGTNANALELSDNLTGVSTVGFGTRIVGYSNSNNVTSVIGFENGGTGTNNESQLSFYTQNIAGGLTRQLLIASTGAATFSSSVTLSGNLTVDTNTLFVDAATNRVGIGIASPLDTLHVNGGDLFFGNESNVIQNIRFRRNGATVGSIGTYGNQIEINGGSTLGAGHLAITSTGNVGISNTSPSYKLDVTGSANSIQARFGNVAGRGLTIGTSAISGTNDAGVVFNAPTATDGTLVFQTSSTDRMTLNSSGLNVATAIAIGTTPDTNLPFKILKNINSTVGIRFENTSTGNVAYSAVQFGTDVTGGTKFANLVYSSSGITESGAYKQNGTSIINTGTGGLNLLAVDGTIRFFTSSSNGTLRAEIANDGFINHYTGTAPSTNLTDGYRQYSADITAGNAAPHFRTENGGIIKLYQQTTGVTSATYIGGAGTGLTDSDTFDGYTIAQIVKALRNAGLLA